MGGVLTEQGIVSLGVAIPLLGGAAAAVSVSATAAIGEVSAKLTGLLSLVTQLTIPTLPTLAIAGAGQALASLEASFALPGPTFQLTAVLAAAAELEASLVNLQAQLAFAVSLGDLLAAGGVALYTYSGTADSFGPEVTAHTSTGISGGAAGDQVNAVILATSVPATAAALAQVFG